MPALSERPRATLRPRPARTVLALALALGLVMTSLACGGTPPSAPARDGAAATVVPGDADGPASPVPEPKHETYGYVPYWEMDDGIAGHLAATDLTTLALFSVTHRRSGALATNQTGYRRLAGALGGRLIREAQERGTRVEVVYTSFGRTKNERFYTEPEAQDRWIQELVGLVHDLGLDGVNVDVEGLPGERVLDYGAFVGRLRAALRERVPDAQVSVATQGNGRGAAMAAAAAAAGADRVVLMGYDYRFETSNAGASAPIERLDGEEPDLLWSLDHYTGLGVPPERTILALPLYGHTWPVAGPAINSPAVGPGDDWVPRRNLRVFESAEFAPTFEPVESVEFYSVERPGADGGPPQWHAVYYDSPRSLTPKLALADARGLAGAGFWAIGYERGLPGYTELIATFRAGGLAAP